MQITKLRLLGFKSFVEPTELWIEPGLTGVVGPNGCGKSNLLEALRWVMGETSYKAMRASAMEDVIFAGTTTRPQRSWAEVTMFVDNSARKAPAGFNDTDVLELTRRIERDMGSAYRINGRDVRARDVKILFEDAATGARSPALVRQGQIGEIVNAKPEQRRRILEDAAGVAGLHSRRHEAELRLKAAEDNLARLGDVLGGLSSQMEGLKRQARQARRYRELSGEIRRTEALALHLAWVAAEADVAAAESALRTALIALGEVTQTEARLLTEDAELADTLLPLREAEATRGVIVARLRIERDTFEKEAERLEKRRLELEARVAELARDQAREVAVGAEAGETLARLVDELVELEDAGDSDADREAEASVLLTTAESALRETEARLAEAQRRSFETKARRQASERAKAERQTAVDRGRRQLMDIEQQRRETASRAPDAGKHEQAQVVVEQLAAEVEETEALLLSAEEQLEALAAAASASRDAAAHARVASSRLQAEVQTLTKLLGPLRDDGLPPIIDQIKVKSGFEMALGAALGDDLDAPADATAGIHWRLVEAGGDDPELPAGIEPLARHIEGPAELKRRLAQVGLVARADGPKLQQDLQVGQRLVSREGDLWRWDGFVAASEAPSAAAVRLVERNRLTELAEREQALIEETERTAMEAERAAARLQAGEAEIRRLRQLGRERQATLVRERESLGHMERQARETHSRLLTLDENKTRFEEAIAEAAEQLAEAELVLETLEADGDFDEAVAVAGAAAEAARRAHSERRDAVNALGRERTQRAERIAATRREQERWQARSADAGRQIEALQTRQAELASELETLAELPATLDERRQLLIDGLAQAERERQHAADRLAAAETAIKRIQQDLRAAQGKVSEAREFRARAEAHLEAARVRLGDEGRRMREALDCSPEECLALAGLEPGAALPDRTDTERQLQRIKTERERLGGVNLNADEELTRISDEHGKLDAERADVEGAVAKLRGAIGQLNREARSRLAEAFNTVNGHFQRLFTTLFGGGEARLEMIESAEDPLEGGLEIIAKPPGKKPATLSLLSGGEQTLTALSLIFAVFLTNPSPICVLDEVDAPLDDSNVDRYCTLMEKMASETATRFLVITHHPMTMARMSRLFGVTMAEKGVSQLVSVDLATAERIVEDDPAEERQGAA